MKPRAMLALLPVLLAVGVLAYGYWHVNTHAWIVITAYDASAAKPPRAVSNAILTFLDAGSHALAVTHLDQSGRVRFRDTPFGDCAEFESQATRSREEYGKWRSCMGHLSRWVMRWADAVRFIEIRFGSCGVQRAPATLRRYRDDWWLWWVPLPHVGGRPHSTYTLHFQADPADCTVKIL